MTLLMRLLFQCHLLTPKPRTSPYVLCGWILAHCLIRLFISEYVTTNISLMYLKEIFFLTPFSVLLQRDWPYPISLQSRMLWSTEEPLKTPQTSRLNRSASWPRDTRRALQWSSHNFYWDSYALWQLCNILPHKRSQWKDTVPTISPQDGCHCCTAGFSVPYCFSRGHGRQKCAMLFAIHFFTPFQWRISTLPMFDHWLVPTLQCPLTQTNVFYMLLEV